MTLMEIVDIYLRIHRPLPEPLKRYLDGLSTIPSTSKAKMESKILEGMKGKKGLYPFMNAYLFARGSGKTVAQYEYLKKVLGVKTVLHEVEEPQPLVRPSIMEFDESNWDIESQLHNAIYRQMARNLDRQLERDLLQLRNGSTVSMSMRAARQGPTVRGWGYRNGDNSRRFV